MVLTELVATGRVPLARALDAMSTAPARILGAADHGGPIEIGRPANLVVFDPDEDVDGRAAVRVEGQEQRLPRPAPHRARPVHGARAAR